MEQTQEQQSQDSQSCFNDSVYLSLPNEKPYAVLKSLYNKFGKYFDIFESKNKYGFGREKGPDDKNDVEFIVFAREDFESNEFYARLSKQHFYLEFPPKIKKDLMIRPLIINCQGRNGLYINNQKLFMGEKRMLRDGDIIGLTLKLRIFQVSYSFKTPSLPISCDLFNKYFIGDIIGRGGCGEVFLCYSFNEMKNKDRDLNLTALKVIGNYNDPMMTRIDQEQFMSKLMKEVNVMKKLRNPHVLELIDHYQTITSLIILVPYMDGGDLLQRVTGSPNRRCNEDDSKFFFLQLALGLEYMHQKGIAHRDIKCENILLSDSGPSPLLKISDFGLSKKLKDKNTVCGTLYYCAPEVLNNEPYSVNVDIWSGGVVLYAMLSGIVPFNEKNSKLSIAQQIIRGFYKFPSDFFGHVSTNAKNIIQMMLQVKPEKRLTAKMLLVHPWLRDPKINHRLHSVYEENFLIDDNEENENDTNVGDTTLTEEIEKTLESVAISHQAKRPRLA